MKSAVTSRSVIEIFSSRDDIIRYLRLMFSNVEDEKSLLICVKIGRCAAKYGRKTLEDFTDEELEETVGEVACMFYDLNFEEND